MSTVITVQLGTRDMYRSTLAADDLLEVLWLEQTVLIVAVGFFDGNGNRIEDVRGLLENIVHLFQGATACLGEEEVYNREDECVTKGCVSIKPVDA